MIPDLDLDPGARCRHLIDRGRMTLDALAGAGSAQNEVYATFHQELKIVYENRDFQVGAASTTTMFGVRSILEGGHLGFITLNSDSDPALQDAAREVQTIARLSPPNPHYCIAPALTERRTSGAADTPPEPDGELGGGPVYLRLDPRLSDMTPGGAIEFTELLIAEARKDSRIAIDRAEFSVHLGCSALVNSSGLVVSRATSSADWYIMGMARDGAQVTSFDYDGDAVFGPDGFDLLPARIAQSIARFRDSLVSSLDPVRGNSYRGPVLLHPRAVLSLFGGVASVNCNARMHLDGMSPWRDRVGASVAHPALTIYEDPANPARPQGWRPFDREGVPTARHNLIEAGCLRHLGHNCYSARRAGSPPTGNAVGGARSQPAIGFANLAIEVAPDSGVAVLPEAELFALADADGKLLLKRFSGNQDHTSGHFSGVAKNSYLMNGRTRGPAIRETMVQGDSFEILRHIVAAGATAHELPGGGLAPYVLVDGLSVTAG